MLLILHKYKLYQYEKCPLCGELNTIRLTIGERIKNHMVKKTIPFKCKKCGWFDEGLFLVKETKKSIRMIFNFK